MNKSYRILMKSYSGNIKLADIDAKSPNDAIQKYLHRDRKDKSLSELLIACRLYNDRLPKNMEPNELWFFDSNLET